MFASGLPNSSLVTNGTRKKLHESRTMGVFFLILHMIRRETSLHWSIKGTRTHTGRTSRHWTQPSIRDHFQTDPIFYF